MLKEKEPFRLGDKSLSIVFCGEAGQGLNTMGTLVMGLAAKKGFHVFSTNEYMSRVRGGSNSTSIIISACKTRSPLKRIDLLIPLSPNSIVRQVDRISKDTLIVGDRENVPWEVEYLSGKFIEEPFIEIATKEIGSHFLNLIITGFISAILEIDKSELHISISEKFKRKGAEVVRKNIEASNIGYREATYFLQKHKAELLTHKETSTEKKSQVLLNGSEAISLGAISGGCNFISAYPMSPSTGVLTFLSKNAKEFNIVCDQAEDEISAINMCLGAWYAGARALVSTSGGGFSLMTEALSLSGVMESPLVIHLAQRPGPATGLPTRTEQGDLNLALYGGHGEFPRIIFSPGSIEECFTLTERAFNLSDKLQVPVIILTDQYLMDTTYNLNRDDLKATAIEDNIVKSEENYKRYEFTNSGISQRAIPDFGEGVVCADSHEHFEDGHLTEDLPLRVKMVNKRFLKLKEVEKEIVSPTFYGNRDFKNLIISWGSTKHMAQESLSHFTGKDFAVLHFSQVYPVDKKISDYLNWAERVFVVENNATGQFANLIKPFGNKNNIESILKYNGLAFTPEEISDEIKKRIKVVRRSAS